MAQISAILFWFAILAYVAATVLYAYFFLSKRASYSWYATFLTGAGFLCHTTSIGLRSSVDGGTVLNGSNTLVLAAWALVMMYFIMEHMVKVKVYGTALVPVGAALMAISQLMTSKTVVVSPLVQDWKIGIHVALVAFGSAAYFIAGVAAAAYLIQESQLKRHRTSVLFKRLPPLASIDLLMRRAVAFAYPAYSGALLLGVFRAIEEDLAGWWADPRVMLAGLVWATFGTYLVLHYTQRASARTTSWIALAGVLIVAVLAVVARTVPAGFHVFGL